MVTGQLDGRKRRLKVEVKSELTGTLAQPLREGISQIKREHPQDAWDALYLDVRNARVIDSMGLNWLLAESRSLRDMNKEFVIRVASPAIYRVLEFARFDKIAVIKYRRRRQLR